MRQKRKAFTLGKSQEKEPKDRNEKKAHTNSEKHMYFPHSKTRGKKYILMFFKSK